MTTQKIADCLCEADLEACAKSITPPWIDDDADSPVRDSWLQVRTLRRQRDGLIELWPHKRDLLNEQFDNCVRKLARKLYNQLFTLTA